MALRIIMDGALIDREDHSNFDNAELVIQRSAEDGTQEFGFSAGVTFYGSAYNYIYDKLVLASNPQEAAIKVDIIDDCCNDRLIYQGELNTESLDWCADSCEITADIQERDLDAEKLGCVESTRVWDNRLGFQQQPHPFFWHCTESRPLFVQDIIMIFTIHFTYFILPVFLVIGYLITMVNIIITVINVVIGVINAIPGVPNIDKIDRIGDGDISFFDDVAGWITEMNTRASGCKFGHPAPLVRSYIQNVCDICGVSFSSTILNTPFRDDGTPNPYYNLCWLEAPVDKGKRDYTTWIDDNKPLLTGSAMLEKLRKPFYANWKIIDGVLYFETEDFFDVAGSWFDATNLDDERIIELCFTYQKDTPPAFTTFQWTVDGVDWVGNEAKALYNDIVDWNPPGTVNKRLRGEQQWLIEFSPARFRSDGISRTIPETYKDIAQLLGGSLLADLLIDPKYDNALILPQDLTFIPKLLIWDGESPFTRAKVIRTPGAGGTVGIGPGGIFPGTFDNTDYYYNYPMYVAAADNPAVQVGEVARDAEIGELLVRKVYIPGNLFDNYLYKLDPKQELEAGYRFELRLNRDCKLLDEIDFEKTIKLPVPGGQTLNGTMSEVRISETEVVITGTV